MNRRGFLGRCLAGAVLGMARVLPMPRFETEPERIDAQGIFAIHEAMVQEWVRLCLETMTPEQLDHYNHIIMDDPCAPSS